MERVNDYRRHAAECVLLSEQTTDPLVKSKLLAMALSWARLAELAERNQHTDVVFEPPWPTKRAATPQTAKH